MSVKIHPVHFGSLVVIVCEDEERVESPAPEFVAHATRELLHRLTSLCAHDSNAARIVSSIQSDLGTRDARLMWPAVRTGWYYLASEYGMTSDFVPPAHSVNLCQTADAPTNISATLHKMFSLYHKLVVECQMYSDGKEQMSLQDIMRAACTGLNKRPILQMSTALARHIGGVEADQRQFNVHAVPGFTQIFDFILGTMTHTHQDAKIPNRNEELDASRQRNCRCFETMGPCHRLNEIEHMQLESAELMCRQVRALSSRLSDDYSCDAVIWINSLIDEPLTMMLRNPPRIWVEEQSRHLRSSILLLANILSLGQGNQKTFALFQEVTTKIDFGKLFTPSNSPTRREWENKKGEFRDPKEPSTTLCASSTSSASRKPSIGNLISKPDTEPLLPLTSSVPAYVVSARAVQEKRKESTEPLYCLTGPVDEATGEMRTRASQRWAPVPSAAHPDASVPRSQSKAADSSRKRKHFDSSQVVVHTID